MAKKTSSSSISKPKDYSSTKKATSSSSKNYQNSAKYKASVSKSSATSKKTTSSKTSTMSNKPTSISKYPSATSSKLISTTKSPSISSAGKISSTSKLGKDTTKVLSKMGVKSTAKTIGTSAKTSIGAARNAVISKVAGGKTTIAKIGSSKGIIGITKGAVSPKSFLGAAKSSVVSTSANKGITTAAKSTSKTISKSLVSGKGIASGIASVAKTATAKSIGTGKDTKSAMIGKTPSSEKGKLTLTKVADKTGLTKGTVGEIKSVSGLDSKTSSAISAGFGSMSTVNKIKYLKSTGETGSTKELMGKSAALTSSLKGAEISGAAIKGADGKLTLTKVGGDKVLTPKGENIEKIGSISGGTSDQAIKNAMNAASIAAGGGAAGAAAAAAVAVTMKSGAATANGADVIKNANTAAVSSSQFIGPDGKPAPFVTAYASAKASGKDTSNWNFPPGVTKESTEAYIGGGAATAAVAASVASLAAFKDKQSKLPPVQGAPTGGSQVSRATQQANISSNLNTYQNMANALGQAGPDQEVKYTNISDEQKNASIQNLTDRGFVDSSGQVNGVAAIKAGVSPQELANIGYTKEDIGQVRFAVLTSDYIKSDGTLDKATLTSDLESVQTGAGNLADIASHYYGEPFQIARESVDQAPGLEGVYSPSMSRADLEQKNIDYRTAHPGYTGDRYEIAAHFHMENEGGALGALGRGSKIISGIPVVGSIAKAVVPFVGVHEGWEQSGGMTIVKDLGLKVGATVVLGAVAAPAAKLLSSGAAFVGEKVAIGGAKFAATRVGVAGARVAATTGGKAVIGAGKLVYNVATLPVRVGVGTVKLGVKGATAATKGTAKQLMRVPLIARPTRAVTALEKLGYEKTIGRVASSWESLNAKILGKAGAKFESGAGSEVAEAAEAAASVPGPWGVVPAVKGTFKGVGSAAKWTGRGLKDAVTESGRLSRAATNMEKVSEYSGWGRSPSQLAEVSKSAHADIAETVKAAWSKPVGKTKAATTLTTGEKVSAGITHAKTLSAKGLKEVKEAYGIGGKTAASIAKEDIGKAVSSIDDAIKNAKSPAASARLTQARNKLVQDMEKSGIVKAGASADELDASLSALQKSIDNQRFIATSTNATSAQKAAASAEAARLQKIMNGLQKSVKSINRTAGGTIIKKAAKPVTGKAGAGVSKAKTGAVSSDVEKVSEVPTFTKTTGEVKAGTTGEIVSEMPAGFGTYKPIKIATKAAPATKAERIAAEVRSAKIKTPTGETDIFKALKVTPKAESAAGAAQTKSAWSDLFASKSTGAETAAKAESVAAKVEQTAAKVESGVAKVEEGVAKVEQAVKPVAAEVKAAESGAAEVKAGTARPVPSAEAQPSMFASEIKAPTPTAAIPATAAEAKAAEIGAVEAKVESAVAKAESSAFNVDDLSSWNQFKNPEIDAARGVESRVVMMTPEEYMTQSGKLGNAFKIKNGKLTGVTSGDRKAIDIMKQQMTSGTKQNVPLLNYADKMQEGAHRAAAAFELGQKEIPVVITAKSGKIAGLVKNLGREISVPAKVTGFKVVTPASEIKAGTAGVKAAETGAAKVETGAAEVKGVKAGVGEMKASPDIPTPISDTSANAYRSDLSDYLKGSGLKDPPPSLSLGGMSNDQVLALKKLNWNTDEIYYMNTEQAKKIILNNVRGNAYRSTGMARPVPSAEIKAGTAGIKGAGSSEAKVAEDIAAESSVSKMSEYPEIDELLKTPRAERMSEIQRDFVSDPVTGRGWNITSETELNNRISQLEKIVSDQKAKPNPKTIDELNSRVNELVGDAVDNPLSIKGNKIVGAGNEQFDSIDEAWDFVKKNVPTDDYSELYALRTYKGDLDFIKSVEAKAGAEGIGDFPAKVFYKSNIKKLGYSEADIKAMSHQQAYDIYKGNISKGTAGVKAAETGAAKVETGAADDLIGDIEGMLGKGKSSPTKPATPPTPAKAGAAEIRGAEAAKAPARTVSEARYNRLKVQSEADNIKPTDVEELRLSSMDRNMGSFNVNKAGKIQNTQGNTFDSVDDAWNYIKDARSSAQKELDSLRIRMEGDAILPPGKTPTNFLEVKVGFEQRGSSLSEISRFEKSSADQWGKNLWDEGYRYSDGMNNFKSVDEAWDFIKAKTPRPPRIPETPSPAPKAPTGAPSVEAGAKGTIKSADNSPFIKGADGKVYTKNEFNALGQSEKDALLRSEIPIKTKAPAGKGAAGAAKIETQAEKVSGDTPFMRDPEGKLYTRRDFNALSKSERARISKFGTQATAEEQAGGLEALDKLAKEEAKSLLPDIKPAGMSDETWEYMKTMQGHSALDADNLSFVREFKPGGETRSVSQISSSISNTERENIAKVMSSKTEEFGYTDNYAATKNINTGKGKVVADDIPPYVNDASYEGALANRIKALEKEVNKIDRSVAPTDESSKMISDLTVMRKEYNMAYAKNSKLWQEAPLDMTGTKSSQIATIAERGTTKADVERFVKDFGGRTQAISDDVNEALTRISKTVKDDIKAGKSYDEAIANVGRKDRRLLTRYKNEFDDKVYATRSDFESAAVIARNDQKAFYRTYFGLSDDVETSLNRISTKLRDGIRSGKTTDEITSRMSAMDRRYLDRYGKDIDARVSQMRSTKATKGFTDSHGNLRYELEQVSDSDRAITNFADRLRRTGNDVESLTKSEKAFYKANKDAVDNLVGGDDGIYRSIASKVNTEGAESLSRAQYQLYKNNPRRVNEMVDGLQKQSRESLNRIEKLSGRIGELDQIDQATVRTLENKINTIGMNELAATGEDVNYLRLSNKVRTGQTLTSDESKLFETLDNRLKSAGVSKLSKTDSDLYSDLMTKKSKSGLEKSLQDYREENMILKNKQHDIQMTATLDKNAIVVPFESQRIPTTKNMFRPDGTEASARDIADDMIREMKADPSKPVKDIIGNDWNREVVYNSYQGQIMNETGLEYGQGILRELPERITPFTNAEDAARILTREQGQLLKEMPITGRPLSAKELKALSKTTGRAPTPEEIEFAQRGAVTRTDIPKQLRKAVETGTKPDYSGVRVSRSVRKMVEHPESTISKEARWAVEHPGEAMPVSAGEKVKGLLNDIYGTAKSSKLGVKASSQLRYEGVGLSKTGKRLNFEEFNPFKPQTVISKAEYAKTYKTPVELPKGGIETPIGGVERTTGAYGQIPSTRFAAHQTRVAAQEQALKVKELAKTAGKQLGYTPNENYIQDIFMKSKLKRTGYGGGGELPSGGGFRPGEIIGEPSGLSSGGMSGGTRQSIIGGKGAAPTPREIPGTQVAKDIGETKMTGQDIVSAVSGKQGKGFAEELQPQLESQLKREYSPAAIAEEQQQIKLEQIAGRELERPKAEMKYGVGEQVSVEQKPIIYREAEEAIAAREAEVEAAGKLTPKGAGISARSAIADIVEPKAAIKSIVSPSVWTAPVPNIISSPGQMYAAKVATIPDYVLQPTPVEILQPVPVREPILEPVLEPEPMPYPEPYPEPMPYPEPHPVPVPVPTPVPVPDVVPTTTPTDGGGGKGTGIKIPIILPIPGAGTPGGEGGSNVPSEEFLDRMFKPHKGLSVVMPTFTTDTEALQSIMGSEMKSPSEFKSGKKVSGTTRSYQTIHQASPTGKALPGIAAAATALKGATKKKKSKKSKKSK